MRWKIILALLLIVGIAFFLFTTPAQRLLGFLNIGSITGSITNFFSGFFSFFYKLPEGNYFTFVLTTATEPLYGQSFQIENGTIQISGIYTTDVVIEKSVYSINGREGEIAIDNFKGTVGISTSRISVSGETSGIVLNSVLIKPSDKVFNIKFEISPSRYFIAPIIKDKIILKGVYGKIEKTSGAAASQELKDETVEISPFIGNIKLSTEYSIDGSTLKINGNTFSWTG